MNNNIEIQEQEEKTKEKENYIAIVLDESGSMGCMKDQAISLFNEQIDTIMQNNKKMKNFISLIKFSSKVSEPEISVKEVKENSIDKISDDDYQPGGGTAFYDGIGKAISDFEKIEEKNEDKDISFLIVAITDGEENSSREWDGSKLSSKIKELEDKGNWTFSVMGANIDMNNLQQSLNIRPGNTYSFNANPEDLIAGSQMTSRGMNYYFEARNSGQASVSSYYSESDSSDEQ